MYLKSSSISQFDTIFASLLTPLLAGFVLASIFFPALEAYGNEVSGELKVWHRVTVTFDGPQTSESAATNPFTDYRLQVTFTHTASGAVFEVPGFYAADGNAKETSASSGNKWRVHFTPDQKGVWTYSASFRTGANVAVEAGASAGKATSFDGTTGSFSIGATDKKGVDHRGKGMLRYVGEYHLQYAESGDPFIKLGPNGPENLLAYSDFDGTYDTSCNGDPIDQSLHTYEPHISDWKNGDPSWKSGKGKGLVGAMNYLSDIGTNSMYFLTYNIDGGDGCDVWPWTSEKTKDRFDVSKLAQWETIFDHMDAKGILLHVILSERQNAKSIGSGNGDDDELNDIRKLYYRELVARFGHHLALQWNLGEENTNNDRKKIEFADYIRSIDPYDHPITVHTSDSKSFEFYEAILGEPSFEATSLQADIADYNALAIYYREQSAQYGRKWSVYADEQSPNAGNERADLLRKDGLWGNLMGGGAGVEWYFSLDLSLEDFRKFDILWEEMNHARQFFELHLPFEQMEPANDITPAKADFVLAKENEVYAVYLSDGGSGSLDIGGGTSSVFDVWWYNPRKGGALQRGDIQTVKGGGTRNFGSPPSESGKDWVVLVKGEGGIVENQDPKAVISTDLTQGKAPLLVQFDASASSDPDGTLTGYDWDFGDGASATGTSTPHTYQVAGTYEAALTVKDNQGATATTSITIVVESEDNTGNLPVISIEATDTDAAEPGGDGNNAKAKVNRTGDLSKSLEIFYEITGTAEEGADYKSIGGSAVFEAGESVVKVLVKPLDDDVAESDETVIITLVKTASYDLDGANSSVSILISDDDTAISFEPIYRVNAGGGGVSDAFLSWDRDTKNKPSPYVNAGKGDNFVDKDVFRGVNNTTAPASIFDKKRWDPEDGLGMAWDFPVTEARSYQIKLFFAETDDNIDEEGERLFDIYIEDKLVLNDYDVYEEVGPQTATKKSFTVTVTDGNIDIDFRHEIDNPFVNGIEITPVATVSQIDGGGLPPVVNSYEQIGSGRWELAGMPLAMSGDAFSSMEPAPERMQFNGQSYEVLNEVVPGKGYWMRSEENLAHRFEGERIDSLRLSLQTGWNLIAGPSCDIELQAEGTVVVPNTLYRYDEGYYPSHRLEEGRGYWLLADEAGSLDLGCSARTPGQDRLNAREAGFGQLLIRNEEGREQALQFGGLLNSDQDKRMFALPPAPPNNGFDARFESGYRLLEKDQASIQLQGDGVIELELDKLPDEGEKEYVITALSRGIEIETQRLRKGDIFTLDVSTDELRLQTMDAYEASLPTSFELDGNFPNPFNPETTIVFALPERAEVEVAVYDMLGRRVMALEPRFMEASQRQQIRLAAGDLASGTYVYQIKVLMGKRVVSKSGTMVLLK